MEKNPSRFHVEPVECKPQNEISSANSSEPQEDKQTLNVSVIDINDRSVNSSVYDSHNVRSLRHYTQEALPRLDHYRNIHSLHAHFPRPTLDELHNGDITSQTGQVRKYFYLCNIKKCRF